MIEYLPTLQRPTTIRIISVKLTSPTNDILKYASNGIKKQIIIPNIIFIY